jgi:hypothetical protein
MLHSRYWRTPHFTYEAGYFFEFTAPEKFLSDWVRFGNLTPSDSDDFKHLAPDQPSWFAPKAAVEYEIWRAAGAGSFDNFWLLRDRTSGVVYVTDSQ